MYINAAPDPAKFSGKMPPLTFYIADHTASLRCIMFNKSRFPAAIGVGNWIGVERFKMTTVCPLHSLSCYYNILLLQGHKSLANFHNGYLSVHNKELNITDAIITARSVPAINRLPPSVSYCWPLYTRGNFLLVVIEIGSLQQVLVKGEHVYLLESFCVDSNDIHTKVIFWGDFAAQVMMCSVWLCMVCEWCACVICGMSARVVASGVSYECV